jgi:hypothetical protein
MQQLGKDPYNKLLVCWESLQHTRGSPQVAQPAHEYLPQIVLQEDTLCTSM